jgi:DNA topoisomerase-1
MKLIVTEKYNAAEKIASILSDGQQNRETIQDTPVFSWGETKCIGLAGHVVALDFDAKYSDWGEHHPEKLVDATIQKSPSKQNLVNGIQTVGENADTVIIATDYDREGELIGKEACELIQEVNPDVDVKRALFSSLTSGEITEAFDKLTTIDEDLAAAGESRQRIDLRWGASLTRFLTLLSERADGIISVGRVQTPTLKLVVDREREIENFDPDTYWEIFSEFRIPPDGDAFEAQYYYYGEDDTQQERVWEEGDKKRVCNEINKAFKAEVKEVDVSNRNDNPPIPFDTTEFIKAANAIGFDAKPAMSIAEELYDNGYITYPRTDNTVYPSDLSIRDRIQTLAGKRDFRDSAQSLLDSESLSPTSGDEETTDHPPIHPTDSMPNKNSLGDDEWEVYELVVRRFFATVAEAAVWERTRVDIDAGGNLLKTSGKELVSAGYHSVYPYFDTEESTVPDVEEGEMLQVGDVWGEEKETQPPNRYGQSKLIEKMESLDLGTKSTRHNTVDTLFDRGYVSGNTLSPTDIAKGVINTVENHAERLATEEMTGELKENMDLVAEGEKGMEEVTEKSRNMLGETFTELTGNEKQIREDLQEVVVTQKEKREDRDVIGKCDECNGVLEVIESKEGSKFIGCSEYPECEVTYPLPNKGKPHVMEETCSEHGLHTVKMIAGSATSVFGCPACKKQQAANHKETIIGDCITCSDGDLQIKRIQTGSRIVGCSEYPDCEYVAPLPPDGEIETTNSMCDEHDVKEVVINNEEYDSPWEIGCPVCNAENR